MNKYKKSDPHSYTLGMFPTMELINNKPNLVEKIIFSSKIDNENSASDIKSFCNKNKIIYEINDKLIDKLSDKDNCYVIGIYKKEEYNLSNDKSHVVLVNPSNMGNLGTIIRTILGFGIKDLAIISPGVDINDPKTVRASMGALFSINYKYYGSFIEYEKEFSNHDIYTFMLDAKNELDNLDINTDLYSLVFGNESSGLPDEYNKYKSIIINHEKTIDSLNLTIAVGIAVHKFYKTISKY